MTPLHRTTVTYSFHKLDLRPDLDVLFENLHRSSTQRKIRRAEREALTYREGSTQEFLDDFYHLFTLTRQRHRLPPQPKAWFANLMDCFGEALKIRLAFKNNRPIATVLTIAYKDTLSYKYGGCDSRFNNLGCMHLLLWKSIQDAKANDLRFLDFGRTNAEQQSLITFKDRWGASQSVVTYSRYGVSKRSTHFFDLSMTKWKAKTAKYVLAHLPPRFVSKIGQTLYGHVG
jgi:lipid II:glycine glycyltransferase (peptidoglycan interpeptide bridge formation enzyme)